MARIATVDNPTDPIVKDIYNKFLLKHKKVPEWIKVMAPSPHILKEFYELFVVIMKEGELNEKIKWHIAHTVSELNKCEFCVDITEQMLKTMGAKDFLNLKDSINETDTLLNQLATEGTIKSSTISEELFDKLKTKLDDKQIIEAISVIGLFNYINRFNNMLVVLPI